MPLVGILLEMHRPVRRLAQLYAGLLLYGASMALQIRAVQQLSLIHI